MKKILFTHMLLLSCMTAAWAGEGDADGFINVDTTEKLWNAIKADDHAKVRLTADFALSDINKDGETFCNTFYGVIDGNGHTIKGDPVAPVRARTYMFTYCDGATIKNLTFKGIRIDNRDNSNQAVIASQAKNSCVFENITLDHISTYTSSDNTGAVVGHADTYCTFKNITVKNSDFTVNEKKSGAVVGSAQLCTFENIKVENCESTARGGESGGVAGSVQHCEFNNVEVLGTFVKTDEDCAGGVVGGSTSSDYTNCIVDDQSCICADGDWDGIFGSNASIGGIVGESFFGSFTNCINSALIAADGDVAGGIVGLCNNGVVFEDCLNTGMIISIGMDEVKDSFYNKYKTKSLTCVTKTYKGKKYVIREYKTVGSYSFFGGITGLSGTNRTNISKCANLGSIYGGDVGNIGGIAGNLDRATIKNCLSDFHGGSGTRAICGAIGDNNGGECFIGSCLNMTTYKDISAYDNNWDGFKSDEKNYSLTTATDAHHTNKTTAAIIESGKICYLLGEAWEQNLGTDAYPTPTGAKGVYHTRNVSNEYGTVCLPYAVKSDDSICYYTFSDAYDISGEMYLMFDYAEDVIPAGTPLLFWVRHTGENSFCRVETDGNAWADQPVESENAVWNFYGTFSDITFHDSRAKDKYYISEGAIKNAQETTVPAFRAYFRGPDIRDLMRNDGGMARVHIVIDGEENEAAALQLIADDPLSAVEGRGEATYTLFGIEASKGYRGLMIRNGKKVVLSL